MSIQVVPETGRTSADYTYSTTEAVVSSNPADPSIDLTFPTLSTSAAVFNFRIEALWTGSLNLFSNPISVMVVSCSYVVPTVPALDGTSITDLVWPSNSYVINGQFSPGYFEEVDI